MEDLCDDLDCYILGDQPVTCGICGARTAFSEGADGVQIHRCLNRGCGYLFIGEFEVD